MKLRFGSVCSGIEAASVAWHPLGWRAAFVSEIDSFPCAVLAHHYPDVPNFGDMTKFAEWPDAAIDVLVGGTPCQSFSVAGLRKGLADPRGNLMLTYLGIAARYRPTWLVWENVPGVLSSGGGRDFGALLGGLAELGYGFAYRVLDAQYFGLAQRRKRVFVVGCLGDWRRAAAVLFERESLSGHPAPSRKARQVAPTIPARSLGGGGLGADFDCDGGLTIAGCLNSASGHAVPGNSLQDVDQGYLQIVAPPLLIQAFGGNNQSGPIDVATAVNACASASGRMDFESETFIAHAPLADGFDASEDGTGRGTPLVAFHNRQDPDVSGDVTHPLGAQDNGMGIAFSQNQRDEVRQMDVAGALASEPGMKQQTYAKVGMQVRRLTPKECCRLQGFPDDYLEIIYRGKHAADGPRYKALGNSMAVPVMHWIGKRIQLVNEIGGEQ